MCGIAGGVGAAPPELLTAMLRRLKHRGPDGDGAHLAAGAALGMTRLAIIDLVTGQQPMANEDGSLWLVFNGEIYNHRQLRPTQSSPHSSKAWTMTSVSLRDRNRWPRASSVGRSSR